VKEIEEISIILTEMSKLLSTGGAKEWGGV
jgi:hypothetical protein